MEIVKLINRCMEDAGAVRKTERNNHQNFNFRGIDSVVNAVSPAFRKHGVVVIPQVNDCIYETVTIGQNRTQMSHVRVNVTYTFHAPDGSSIAATVSAESMDSGDKATAKAMSVAFRTALLQTLCLPTDDTDPDADTYVRSESASISKPAQKSAPASQSASERAPLGSKAQQSDKPQNAGAISEKQMGFIRKLASEVGSDDELLHNLAGKSSLKDLSGIEASALIADLLAIKAGQAHLRFDGEGRASVVAG